MLRRFFQYCSALFVLGLACAAYQSIFVAWVEPNALPAIKMAASPVLRTDDTLVAMFPPNSWQRGNCKRLQTRDGVLLFQNWQQMSDDQWKLWPVSVVMGINGNSPLILEANEGAEIKFTESLDVMSGGAPPIERGRMIGAVTIHNVDKRSALHFDQQVDVQKRSRRIIIEASEVGIDHRKVWTTQPIRLQLGDVKVSGRDLTLHLATAGGIDAAGDNALSILDRLELIYLDELSVPLADGGLWGNINDDSESQTVTEPGRPTPIARPMAEKSVAQGPGLATLRCGGRVVFQFATGELTLQDRVELRHLSSATSTIADTFVCDQLRLRFADLLAKRQRGDQLQNYLLSMVAIGRPARASIPSFDAELAAGQIELDTRSNLVRMGGPAGVLVSYAGTRWQFGQINYLINPIDPKELGTFDAIGPGGMDVERSLEVPIKRLQWSGGVKLEQLQSAEQLSLRVDGEVEATMTDGGTFQCDSARLLLQQLRKPNIAPEKVASSKAKTRLVPKQFQATGAVSLETPMIAVATRLLQLYFEVDPETPAGVPSVPSTAKADGSLRGWVKQPGAEPSTTKLATNSTPLARSRPSIHGDTINAKLRLSGGDVTARDLSVVGNVSLHHEIEMQNGTLPAVLTGDRLLLSDSGGSDVLQIGSGVDRPARFDLGDGFFIGPLIQVRMADNVVWIKDAGEFQLPTQVLPRVGSIVSQGGMLPLEASREMIDKGNDALGGSSQPKPANIEWVNAPKCRWQGQMVFDGRTATLTDGVDIHATIIAGDERDVWDLQITGDQLQMVLEQSVSVRDVESVKAATVDQVSITSSAAHPLLITANQLTASGLRKSRHVLAAPQLTMKPETGLLSGPGPGWYRAWTQSNPTPQFTQSSNDPDASMFGIHLAYEQTLDADLNSKSLEFNTGVRIAGRRVLMWDEVIDVALIKGLRLGESTLDCDRLRLAIDSTRPWAPSSAAWEMESIGNVAFQTRIERGLFSGTADRASYSAAKDLFLIEGSPGRSAVLNQTLPTGQPGLSVAGKRMTANPKTMELQNFEFDRLQLGTLPSGLGP